MALPKTKFVTLEDFSRFVGQPENAGRLFELINGEISEVSPGRTSISQYGHILAFEVRLFCRDQGLPCHTSGGDGAYAIQGNVVAPDFAYKRTPMSDVYPDPEPPEWAVEIISPTDTAAEIRDKREIYRRAGILLWEMYPSSRSIDVYVPGQPVRVYSGDDILDGGDLLPGFRVSVKKLFGDE